MNYVIASHRPWNQELAKRLSDLTGHSFVLINHPEQLTVEALENIQPRYVFFPHWSYIIPNDIFSQFECVIFHMTDVPFGRGGSPLQNLIVRGFEETKMTALKCVAELDAGPVYLKKELSLKGTAEQIFQQADGVIESMIQEIVNQEPVPYPQDGEVTVFKRRKSEEGNIQALTELRQVYDYIRMLDAEGYPSAFLETNHLKLEFCRANFQGNEVMAEVRITQKGAES